MSSVAAKHDENTRLHEVVGVFFEADSLEKAIEQLREAGFNNDRLGLLAHSDAVSGKLDHLYEKVGDTPGTSAEHRFVEKRSSKSSANAFLGGLGTIASAAASGAIVASAAIVGGPVGAAIAGVLVVGGIGAVASTVISETDSQHLQTYLEEGHLLLFVRTIGTEEEAKAKEVMSRFSGVDTMVLEFDPD